MIPFVLFTNTINTYVKTKIGDIVTAELGTFIKLTMNQIKICLWECTQQQLRCYAPKRKRRRCDETTITGCTGSYHFDNLQCGQWRKSKKLSLLCMSDIWKHGHVESPYANARCWGCYCDHPGHSQWSKGCHSTHVTESPIFRSQLLLQI